MMRNQRLESLLLMGLLTLGSACTSEGTIPLAGGGAGRMQLRLVDAPADDVKEIVVTITRVEAHVAGGGGWMVLAEKTATIDLLKLQGGTFAELGVVAFPGGKITQLRLYVKEDGPNYVTTPDGAQHPLTVPSGPQSGIKIKGGFDWSSCDIGNVTIDFDGKKSIHVHPKGAGAGDEWLLRPVVRLKSVSVTGDACKPDASAPPPAEMADAGPPVENPPPAEMADAGSPPVMTPPPNTPDPCDNVMCQEGQFCYTGTCVNNID
jgi:hypothetical protein